MRENTSSGVGHPRGASPLAGGGAVAPREGSAESVKDRGGRKAVGALWGEQILDGRGRVPSNSRYPSVII